MASAQQSADTGPATERISPESLARLWANRVHESNWLKSVACWLGLHRWHEMRFEGLTPPTAARFCRWCAKLERKVESGADLEVRNAQSN